MTSNFPSYVPENKRKPTTGIIAMPLTDEEYFQKYGKTKQEMMTERKENSRAYAKEYYHKNKGTKRDKPKKKEKKSTAIVVRKKREVKVKDEEHKEINLPSRINFTTEDIFLMESMFAEAREMLRGGMNALADRVRRRTNGNS